MTSFSLHVDYKEFKKESLLASNVHSCLYVHCSLCMHRISVRSLKLVLSWMLADAEHATIGDYGVSGIIMMAIAWHGILCP